MNETEVLALLERYDAVRAGHFKLSSGLHSDRYVQCAAVLQWPHVAERLGHELASRFADAGATAVLGPAMGGLLIAHEVARHLDVRMVFSERVDGAMRLRRGFAFAPTDRVLVAEDVVSTGRSQREAMAVVTDRGADVVGVGAIVNRWRDASFGVPFAALLPLAVEAWEPDACPLCASGLELEAPGSRHLVR